MNIFGGSGFASITPVPLAMPSIPGGAPVATRPTLGEQLPSTQLALRPGAAYLRSVATNLGTRAKINVMCGGGAMAFDGESWVPPPRGDYFTYRLMSLDPTLKVVYRLIASIIQANTWTAEGVDKDVPEAWVTLVKKRVLPLRPTMLPQTLPYLKMGYKPFEKVWDFAENEWFIRKLKPYPVEGTTVCLDRFGNFAGFTRGSLESLLPPNKCWVCTCDREDNYFYGESRHEGAYDPWCDSMRTRFDAARLRGKLSGILPTLYYPRGDSEIDGKMIPNDEVARMMLDSLSLGNGVALQNLSMGADMVSNLPSLASTSMWKLEFYDAGTLSPAVEGMVKEREYNDKLKVRGWGRPERSVLEASRAGIGNSDTEEFTDASISDDEMIETDITQQLSFGGDGVCGVADDTLLYNVGPQAVGKVLVKPTKLKDEKIEYARDILKTLLGADQGFRSAFYRAVSVQKMLDAQEFPPGEEPFDPELAIETDKQNDMTSQVTQAFNRLGNKPPGKGRINGNGRTLPAS